MSDEARLVGEVARQVLRDVGADPWAALVAQEWVGVAVDAERGGQGGTLAEAAALAEAAGATAAQAPVLEAVLAALAAASLGGAGDELVASLAGGAERAVLVPRPLDSEREVRTLVPWARGATSLLAVVDGGGAAPRLAKVPCESIEMQRCDTLAGEPADLVTFPAEALSTGVLDGELDRDALRAVTALLSAARLVGALDTVHRMTVEHAEQREQFGVPLARFQALAHAVARQAAACELARAALHTGLAGSLAGGTMLAVAARVSAGEVSREVARIGHQVHGAIGVTREHDLHRFTLRLRAWRDAYGTARRWETLLGRMVAGRPDELWNAALPELA